MKNNLVNDGDVQCVLKQLWDKISTAKKKKCCKSYKTGKRCRKCPKK